MKITNAQLEAVIDTIAEKTDKLRKEEYKKFENNLKVSLTKLESEHALKEALKTKRRTLCNNFKHKYPDLKRSWGTERQEFKNKLLLLTISVNDLEELLTNINKQYKLK